MMEQQEPSTQNFAAVLRVYRKRHGWTQSELAEYWSYSFETVSAWERGKRFPSRTELPRVAQFLEMELDELMALVVASKGGPVRQGPPLIASRVPPRYAGEASGSSSSFPQGRLLWTLHLGIEEGDLKCVASCPLDNGATWDIALDAEGDFEVVRSIYQLIQDRVFFQSRRQETASSVGMGNIVPFGVRSNG